MKIHLVHLVALAALTLSGAHLASAQTSEELGKEIEALRQGQTAIQKDLAEIKKLLERVQPRGPQPFKPVQVRVKGSPQKGGPNAKVTLVEFTDYQCPFCRRHADQVMPQIIKDYVETGKLRYVLREYPLERLHPQAAKASEAALCAGDQNRYWEMRDLIFSDQRKLGDKDLQAHAEALGLVMPSFQSCLEDGKYGQTIKADVSAGSKAGISGTPSFLLGLTDPSNPDTVTATQLLRGAKAYADFQRAIDGLLSDKAAEAEAPSE